MTSPTPYYDEGGITIYHADCREVLPTLDTASADATVTDPPYFRVKGDAWDRQWDDADRFIAWIGDLCDEWQRVLRPNGSLYVFASPRMAARVEEAIRIRFQPLNRIRWIKDAGWHRKANKESLRSYLSPWEEIIFAEQYGSDGSALRKSGYDAACADLHAGVFEPLRRYLVTERDNAGFTNRQVDAHLGTNGMAGHYFGASQWALPTEAVYRQLRELLNDEGEYKHLRREYEDLRREYEDLRRPFNATLSATDLWHFSPVRPHLDKHACEKPVELLRHAIGTSTRPGAVVLDCFAGSGSTLVAAQELGRKAIGIELEERYCEIAANRLQQVAVAA